MRCIHLISKKIVQDSSLYAPKRTGSSRFSACKLWILMQERLIQLHRLSNKKGTIPAASSSKCATQAYGVSVYYACTGSQMDTGGVVRNESEGPIRRSIVVTHGLIRLLHSSCLILFSKVPKLILRSSSGQLE